MRSLDLFGYPAMHKKNVPGPFFMQRRRFRRPFQGVNPRYRTEIKLSSRQKPACTLRVPRHLYDSHRCLLRNSPATRECLHVLLTRYRFRVSASCRSERRTALTSFHYSRRPRERVDFRADLIDWIELTVLARTCGVSANHLFIKLLELHDGDRRKTMRIRFSTARFESHEWLNRVRGKLVRIGVAVRLHWPRPPPV